MYMKNVKKIILLFYLAILSSCITNTEDYIMLLENKLESFIGKNVRDVLNEYGQPVKYINTPDLPGQQSGTYMVYDWSKYGDNCRIMFKYAKKTLKIIDWDYNGNCLLFDGK